MTTPLPPLPKTDLGLCFFDEGGAHPCDGNGYTAEQMQAYATAACADLEANNKRLREALIDIKHGLEGSRIWGGTGWTYNSLHPVHYRPLIKKAEAALKETP